MQSCDSVKSQMANAGQGINVRGQRALECQPESCSALFGPEKPRRPAFTNDLLSIGIWDP